MRPVVLSPFVHRLLHIIIFLFIPVAIMAPHIVVWEITIGGLIGLYYCRKQSLPEIPLPLTIILLMIPLWAMVTTLWAKYPLSSLMTSLKILALVILGLYWCRLTLSLPLQSRKSLLTALITGFLFGMFFLVGDIWLKNPWQIFWQKSSAKALAQGSLIVSLVAWPIILWVLQRPYSIYGRIGLLVSLLISIFWVLLQIDCDTSFIGLFMGICVFLGVLLLPRIASFGMRLFVPIIILSFPFISLFAFKPEHIPSYNNYMHEISFIDRLYIWNDVATTILDHPWKGIGVDGTRHHEKNQEFREWQFIDELGKQHKVQTQRFGIHPHNAILQLWLELGFLGLILGTLLAYQVLRQIYCANLSLVEKAVSSGLFTAVFLVVWVNLGFWQNWWISALWIIVGLTISLFKGTGETSEKVYA